MNVLAVLATITTITFTSPCWQARQDSVSYCEPDTTRVAHSLQKLRLVGWRRYGASPETLAINDLAYPCQPETLRFDNLGITWTIFAVVGTDAGWSCASNLANVNLPVSVDDMPWVKGRREYFDVAGRRVSDITKAPNGIYLVRIAGRSAGKVVVLR